MPFGFFVEVSPGDRPSNELPGGPPAHIGGLPPGVNVPGNELPVPPPGVWPPPTASHPIVPIGPDNTLPVAPGTIWPSPGKPDRPSNELPGTPSTPDNTLPSSKFWVVAGIPGVGWRYVCVDPSLVVGTPLPPAPTPAPKA